MRALRKSAHLSHSQLIANGVRHNTTATPTPKSLTSVLIANRGEIALRVGRTASQYGIKTTTLYTDPDARSQHALSSPYAVNLGDPSAYLDGDRIIKIAQQQGCQGIHPGYGFVSNQGQISLHADHVVAEREPHICKEMHRSWLDLHWPSMAGHQVHGK